MPVNVIDILKAKNNGIFPVVEDVDVLGGWRVVANIAARNALPAQKRKVGMRCKVVDIGKLYELVGSTDNAGWVECQEGIVNVASGRVDQSESDIVVSIDYTNGSSPPPGTLVHTQAEYDALGYSLKYIQDAYDIIPIGRGHNFLAYLEDGIHYAKVDAFGPGSGRSANLVMHKSFLHTSNTLYVGSRNAMGTIRFVGRNRTVVEAAQAGTVVAAGNGGYITVTGTPWTADQFKGKMAIILTGASAGKMFPIRTNTSSGIFAPGPIFYTGGACTFEIYTPAARILATADGSWTDPCYYAIYATDTNTTIPVSLENVELEARNWWGIMLDGSPNALNLLGCVVISSLQAGPIGVYGSGSVNSGLTLAYCAFNFDTAWPIWIEGSPECAVSIAGCFFYGEPSGSYSFIYCVHDALLYISASTFTADPGTWAGSFIWIKSSRVKFQSMCMGFGNDVCTAVAIDDMWGFGHTTIEGYYFYISHCGTVINVISSTGLTQPEYAVGWYGDNNGKGWNISGGAKVRDGFTGRFTSHTTTPLTIDGVDMSAYYPPALGDEIIGQYGSSFKRIST